MNENLRGAYRADGTWLGFDYGAQHWIDTAPYAVRDPAAPAGTASNPLPRRIVPCHHSHCRHYDLEHGQMCAVEARQLGLI